jgi:hypothetical protein
LMPLQKTLHSSPPVDVFAKTHHAGSWSWSVTHFGCGLTAALWSFASLRGRSPANGMFRAKMPGSAKTQRAERTRLRSVIKKTIG